MYSCGKTVHSVWGLLCTLSAQVGVFYSHKVDVLHLQVDTHPTPHNFSMFTHIGFAQSFCFTSHLLTQHLSTVSTAPINRTVFEKGDN